MQDIVKKIITLAGGAGNISELDNCLTRVRIVVKDENRISQAVARDLEKEKHSPVIHGKNVHVIIGTKAGEYKKAIAEEIKNPAPSLAWEILTIAGGPSNVAELDNCLTRVRLIVRDTKVINSNAVKALEQQGFPSVIHEKNIHVIVGRAADVCAKEIRKYLS